MADYKLEGFGSLNAEPQTKEEKIKAKYKEILTRSVRDFEEIIEFPIEEGTQYRIVTTKNFNGMTFLSALLKKYELEEIVLSVYRINIGGVEVLREFAEELKTPIYVLLSSFFKENKKYERWTELIEKYGKEIPNLNVGFAWSHTKIYLFKTTDNMNYVLEGSGNLSDSACIEQYLLEENKQVYKFHEKWIKERIKNSR